MDLEATCDAIRTMQIRGAGRIGTAAAQALADHMEGASDPMAAAGEAARLLLTTRPTAVTLENAVPWVLEATKDSGDPVAAARHAAQEWGRLTEEARDALVAAAAEHCRGRIFTHCHSSTVVDALVAAHKGGAELDVVCTETRPFDQGRITSKALLDAGVPVTLVVDSAAHTILAEGADQVLVGADAVTRDGWLINKIGTAGIAGIAGRHDIPVWSLASSDKFTPRNVADIPIEDRGPEEVWSEAPAGLSIRNPVFDATAPEDYRGIITEAGPIAPKDAAKVRPFRITPG